MKIMQIITTVFLHNFIIRWFTTYCHAVQEEKQGFAQLPLAPFPHFVPAVPPTPRGGLPVLFFSLLLFSSTAWMERSDL